jgi:DNA-binding HxlR family transcriptional regulator
MRMLASGEFPELDFMKERLRLAAKIAPTLFIGKWTVEIIHLLREGPQRHGQLQRRLGNISQRMLTRTLRNLEAAGLVSRRVTPSKRVAVEYALTKRGKSFVGPLGSICRWADRHGEGLSATVQLPKRGE